MITFVIYALFVVFFVGNSFTKDIIVGLTFSHYNQSNLDIILKQMLTLSSCPAKNYSIYFVPFNVTPLFQSPMNLNPFKDVYMAFGPNRYFGPSFYGFPAISTEFSFKSEFLSAFSMDLETRFKIMIAVLSNIMVNDTFKSATFILNGSLVDPMQPWKKFNPHQYLLPLDGTITTYYYYNISDAVRIAAAIKAQGATNIVMDLNNNASLEVLKACNGRNLLNWVHRWMIFFSLISSSTIAQVTLPASNNFTLFDFGKLPSVSSESITEETDVYLYDICYTLVNLMDFQNCNKVFPSPINLGTGAFTFSSANISRSSWIVQAYQYSGSLKNIGNVVSTSTGITVNLPIIPNIINRTSDLILAEMRSKPFRIAAMLESPFVYYDNNSRNLTGFSIETINRILTNLNLSGVITTYNLSTGTLQNGKFSGILGILQSGLADIAIGPITNFSSYQNYINFTTAIKSYQLAIIYNSIDTSMYEVMFEFIFAFTWHVWVMIVGSCLVYAMALFVVNIISPNEAKMGILDTFFLTMGSMVQGVTTALPDKVSGKILVIFWWILNICILLAYVSNYGANRTSTRLQATIASYSDLLKQTKYSFGTVINSSVDEYLAASPDSLIQNINTMIRTVHKLRMSSSTNDSMAFVRTTNFAFIYHDAVLNQFLTNKCLVLTEGFGQLQYVYALTDSDYTTVINNELNILMNNNFLSNLTTKYFGPVTQPKCSEANWLGTIFSVLATEFLASDPKSLSILQTSGIFVIMLVGIIISLVLAIIEFIIRKCTKPKASSDESTA